MSSPILKILQRRVIPWVEQFGTSRLIIAEPSWEALRKRQSALPPGVRVVRRRLLSERTPVKGKRQYGNAALIDAHWPKDNLQSGRAPLMVYSISGVVDLPLGGYSLQCEPGHAVLIPPGVAHFNGKQLLLDESIPDNTSCQMLMLRPYNGGLECWLSYTRDGEHWSHRSPEESCRIPGTQAIFYLETLTAEVTTRARHHEAIAHSLLVALVHLLLRELQDAERLQPALALPGAGAEKVGANHDSITEALIYIQGHLSEELSLDQVARSVYMSRRHFSDQFRKSTGQSFLEYLTERRFDEACTLLKNTDWSVGIISGFVGIKPGRLRTLFHERVCMTPTQYRDSHRKKSALAP